MLFVTRLLLIQEKVIKVNTLIVITMVSCVFTMGSCRSITAIDDNFSYQKSLTSDTSNTGVTTLQFINAEMNRGLNANILMPLSYNLGGAITMYQLTNSSKYLDEALNLSIRVIQKSQVVSNVSGNNSVFKDNYRGFLNKNPDYNEDKRGGPHMMEVPLYESYFYRYLAKLLYVYSISSKKIKTASRDDDFDRLLEFIVTHGWEKWYVRGASKDSCMPYLFRSRTHMAAHWATVALFLSQLNDDPDAQKQYIQYLDSYNAQLRDNLRINELGGYIWNMTWDNTWPVHFNCNRGVENGIIQDGDHGNHVISYIVEAYDLHRYWTDRDIERFVITTQKTLYNASEKMFYSSLDREYESSFVGGLRYADGFLKLARYDKELFESFRNARIAQCDLYHFRYGQSQYVAEYLMAQSYWSN